MATARASPPARRQPGDRDLTPDAAQVLRDFRVIFNSVRKHFRTVEKKAGISAAQIWALGVIAQHPGVGVNELASAMEVHQSTASNLLRNLTAEGLVLVARDEFDKRAVHVHISKAGERLLRKAPEPYSGVLPDALLALDPRALKRLRRDLAALIAVLSPNEDGAKIPLWQQDR